MNNIIIITGGRFYIDMGRNLDAIIMMLRAMKIEDPKINEMKEKEGDSSIKVFDNFDNCPMINP